MQYWVVICCMRTELLFIQFCREKWKLSWFYFALNRRYLMSRWSFFHFISWYSKHGRTLVLVKLINWCIFYVAVASALMLCNRRKTEISCVFWFGAEPLGPRAEATRAGETSVATHQTPEGSNCDRTWLWWIRSLVFSFFLCFYNPSVICPDTPTPKPPKPYKEGRRCVLFVRREPTCLQ